MFLSKIRQDLFSPFDLLKDIDDKLLYLALRPSGGEESPLLEKSGLRPNFRKPGSRASIIIEKIQEEYGSTDHQRLEFLGDCVLEMVVRLNLFNRFYLASLHEIHQVKQALVNNQTLACFSNRLGLCFEGGKVCADYLEAIIGAIYIHLQYKETPDAIREIGDWLNEVVHLDTVIDALLFGQGDEPEDEFHACIAPRFREKITKH